MYTLVVGGGSWSTPIASTGRPETAELPMTIATDADDIVVVTQPGISLSGQVVLSDAAPASAPRMRIAFRRGDSSPMRSPDREATVGEDLRFQADAISFGPRLVRVSGLSQWLGGQGGPC